MAHRGRGCRLVAAALLLGALLLPAATRAERIALVGADGGCILRQAPPGTAAAVGADLAQEAAAIGGFAARPLGDAAIMRFAPTRERVPVFGDWAYGWVQSYVTSYRVLARGIVGMSESVAGRGEWPSVERIASEMSEPIRDEFRRRVLAPVLEEGGFAPDLAHVGAELDRAWDLVLRRAAARIPALPSASGALPGAPALRIDLAAAATPVAPDLAAVAQDPVALIAAEGSDSATVFLRSMRPMAARLGAVVVRVSEAGSLVATGGAFGYALAGLPGTAAGLASGIGASWALDWAFNRLDASLNRRSFEAQALAALDQAEARLSAASAAAASAALEARLAASLPREGGCR